MSHPADPAAVAVAFQALGALMLGLLVLQLGRALYFRPARMWALGWVAQAIALGAIDAWIYVPNRAEWFVYLGGQWIFLALLWAGCRDAAADGHIPLRGGWIVIPIAIVAAVEMIRYSPTFNDLFIIDAAIFAAGMAASAVTLRHAQRSPSWSAMQWALGALAALYAAYVPLYAIHTYVRTIRFLQYSSLIDLLAEMFLGFSMILWIAENEREQLRRSMMALDVARSEAEQRLHVDPLTEVLNRYAFHAMQRGDEIATEGVLAGVVAVFDIDNLKRINDQYGHTSGDHAIRAAATAIRNRVRAEDLLFRWGGDEFVVILPNFTADQLRTRLQALVAGVTARTEGGAEIRFYLSWGDAEFGAKRTLGDAIQIADAAMYKSRRDREKR